MPGIGELGQGLDHTDSLYAVLRQGPVESGNIRDPASDHAYKILVLFDGNYVMPNLYGQSIIRT